jgi:hypothetical protein
MFEMTMPTIESSAPAAPSPNTCGEGLASYAPLPAGMAALIDALAETLEAHLPGVEESDPTNRPEREAYTGLARTYREIAAHLRTAAEEMDGYRTLPMGRHDVQVMAGPRAIDAFQAYVQREKELLALLQSAVTRDEPMLHDLVAMAASPD